MHKHGLCRHRAMAGCPSVCMSYSYTVQKRLNILKLCFTVWQPHAPFQFFFTFLYQLSGEYRYSKYHERNSDRVPLNGGVKYRHAECLQLFLTFFAVHIMVSFYRAMLCISAVYAVIRCLSVCPSVCVCLSVCRSRSWIMSKRINISSKFFHHRVATPFQFFHTKRGGDIQTGTPLTGASNAGGVQAEMAILVLQLAIEDCWTREVPKNMYRRRR